jgi:hypothetical protein
MLQVFFGHGVYVVYTQNPIGKSIIIIFPFRKLIMNPNLFWFSGDLVLRLEWWGSSES